MMGFIESKDSSAPPEGLSEAAEVLSYLSNSGNRAAELRFGELKDFCCHVWSPDQMSEGWAWLKDENAPSITQPVTATISSNQGQSILIERLGMMYGQTTDEWSGWNAGSDLPSHNEFANHGFDLINFENFNVDLSQEAGDIYSCFNDPSLPLTGVDDVDWAEIGKVFHIPAPDEI